MKKRDRAEGNGAERDSAEHDAAERALVARVELAVGALRAFARRKRRVREELLAHLVMTYDEELGRAESGEAALAATLERWGDAREIARELQSSVPILERFAAVPLPQLAPFDGLLWKKRPRESTLGYASRFAVWLTASTTALGAVALGALALFSNGPSMHVARGALDSIETFGAVLVAIFASGFVVAALFDRLGLRARIEPGSTVAPLAKGAIVASYVVGMVVSFLAFFASALVALPSSHAVRLAELSRLPVPYPLWVLGAVPLVFLFIVTFVTTAAVALEERARQSRLGVE